MELLLKTLTPIWTGGADAGKVDRVHETGVIGSLRWWMETFVRGLGGEVNDPTQNERSQFDLRKFEKSKAENERDRLRDAGLCNVSQVFGGTGWRRRFRLEIQDQTNAASENEVSTKIEAERPGRDKNGKPTWHFKNKPRCGDFTVHIHSIAKNCSPEVIAGLIQFVADWAAFGARAQMGFGVVEITSGRIELQPLYDWLIAGIGNQTYSHLPSLQNVFLARIKPIAPQSFNEKTTFNLKYDLRQLFRGDERLRHFVMGTIKDGRIASKIKVSRPYGEGFMRVWGWIPENAKECGSSWTRDAVVARIYELLKKEYTLEVWREMNSMRDSVTPRLSDPKAFLAALLGLAEANRAV